MTQPELTATHPPLSAVAVVGCGWVGERHARAFRSIGVRLAWAVETSKQRRDALAAATGAAPAADLGVALSDPSVGAVVICLPHRLHAAAAVRSLKAGKHVLCEKPLATNLPEADAMIAAAQQAARVLMVAENVWFDPALLRIRDLVAGGAIGPVSLVQISWDVWMSDADLEARPYGTGPARPRAAGSWWRAASTTSRRLACSSARLTRSPPSGLRHG